MRVGREHFGKTGKCAKCRQPLTVTDENTRPLVETSATQPVDEGRVDAGQDVGVTEHIAETESGTTRVAPSEETSPGTQPVSGMPSQPAVPSPPESVPVEWNVGDVILDEYEVTGKLGEGGMGTVLKIHHLNWDLDMAVKSPKAEYFREPAQKENFVTECHAWMDLGLHPHIVTCHYVRVLGGVPRVFAEYVDGGSLKDWIKDRRLYEGGKEKALERILDVAIQFAWGLHCAHEKGLIHQDVKPDNVMLTVDGQVKVTDFGLANAQAVAYEGTAPSEGTSILASFGGMTPAYCSPEQADNAARRKAGIPRDQLTKLTRRTDIYSWAVSVLEMFAGEVFWMAGNVVGEALDSFLDQGPEEESLPDMLEAMVELLKRCLQKTPENRPQDFAACVSALREIYRSVAGTQYPTEQPAPVTELADVLNNKALSFLDLDPMKYGDKAEALWQEAQVLHRNHLQVTYNFGLRLWRTGRETDVCLLTKLQECAKDASEDPQAALCLGWVQWERGELEEAEQLFEQAVSLGGSATASVWREQAFARKAESARCLRTFEVEDTPICFSADACWALSGRQDKTLRLWEVATGKCLRSFEGHTGDIKSACFSADGRWALSGSEDMTLRLWEVATGKSVRKFAGHSSWVNAVCLTVDGRWAMSGSEDMTLRLWEVETGRCLCTYEGHKHRVESVALNADGQWALSVSSDSTLRLWEVATGKCLRTLEHTNLWASICLSGDGRWGLSGSSDETLRLWEMETGRCLRIFQGHVGSVSSVYLSEDERWVLSGSHGTLQLWEVGTGKCLRTFEDHKNYVGPVFLSGDGRWALSMAEATLRMWDVSFFTSGSCEKAPDLLCRVIPAGQALEAQESFDEHLQEAKQRLESGDSAGALKACRTALSVEGHSRDSCALDLLYRAGRRMKRSGLRAAWHVRTFEGHMKGIDSVCMSENRRWALTGSRPGLRVSKSSEDGTLKLWDVHTGRCMFTLAGQIHPVFVALSTNGRWGLSGEYDTIRLWDVETGECLRSFEGHTRGVTCACFSADACWALTGSADKTLRLWEVATGRCLRAFEGHLEHVASVCLSPDGRWALSGSGWGQKNMGRTLKLWDVSTGRCLRDFDNHSDRVNTVCLSADGCWALSNSVRSLGYGKGVERVLQQWDVATGSCVRTFERYTSVLFLSADGLWALSESVDNTFDLWEVQSERCVRTFEGHRGIVLSACLSEDGRWALSGSEDKTLRLWELDWEWEAVDPADWDEGARPYLVNFLTLHTPYAAVLPQDHEPSPDEITRALTREGRPTWTDDDFQQFLYTLGCAGYGWLRPEGVRKELEKIAKHWTGPPPLEW
jgi:WD40 repeat protein/serine/threonine protein kinase